MAKRVAVAVSRSVHAHNGQATKPDVAKARAGTPGVASWSAAPPGGPAPEAVAAFEGALRDLQLHKFQDAGKKLRLLLTNFPGEQALLDRVRVYLDLCNREQQRRPSAPITIE